MLMIGDESIALAIEGDRDEAEKLFRALAPRLRQRISLHFPEALRPLVEVEDVLQETLTEAFIDIQQCRAECVSSFFAWLNRIAANNVADLQRGLFAVCRDVRRTYSSSSTDEPLQRLAWGIIGSEESPSFSAQQSEMAAKLREAIEQLPDTYRAVVILYDLRQEPIESIAQRIGCSAGSIYMRRRRAHRMLHEILEAFSLYA